MLVPWEELVKDNEEARQLSRGLQEVGAADPLIFDEIIRGMLHPKSEVRLRAADMVEAVTQERPMFLRPYQRVLLGEMAELEPLEVRITLALLYGRVMWDEWDMKQVVVLLEKWSGQSETAELALNSLLSLNTLAQQKHWVKPHLIQCLDAAKQHGCEAVRQYADKLMAQGL